LGKGVGGGKREAAWNTDPIRGKTEKNNTRDKVRPKGKEKVRV